MFVLFEVLGMECYFRELMGIGCGCCYCYCYPPLQDPPRMETKLAAAAVARDDDDVAVDLNRHTPPHPLVTSCFVANGRNHR